MAEDMSASDVLNKLNLVQNESTNVVFTTAGITPLDFANVDMKKTVTVFGITPEDFSSKFSTTEFDFDALMQTFAIYCKDFENSLEPNVPSRALEFSAKILFEYGPYMRQERKGKGDKAIRFRFPYFNKERSEFSIRVVIVSTFKDMVYKKMEVDNKMVITFKQATMLAMVTFNKAIDMMYRQNNTILMSPLCGATFSREGINKMAIDLNMQEVELIKLLNSSTTNGGHNLPESDMACAIVAVISATKGIANKNIRSSIISKTIKQYSSKHKTYNSDRFNVFARYALGGVPPGMDSETLIQNFTNVQTYEVNSRVAARARMMEFKKQMLLDSAEEKNKEEYERAMAARAKERENAGIGTSEKSPKGKRSD